MQARLGLVAALVALTACNGTTATRTTATSGQPTGASTGLSLGATAGGSGASSATATGSATTTSSGETTATATASSGTAATSETTATSTSAGSTATSSTGATSGASGSSGAMCLADNEFASSASQCCSGYRSGSYCAAAPSASGSSGTTGVTTAGATGTTSSGMCPMNMPDLNTGGGTTTIVGSCSETSENACPQGYQCIANQCVLNTSSSLQITMSFDNIEDFDLHLIEPLRDGGTCEIFYGNPGINPDAGSICAILPFLCVDGGGFVVPGEGVACPEGWLDRDTNAACDDSGGDGNGNGGTPDGVNVENILFRNGVPPPSGTYRVRVDYWENCDSVVCSDGQDATACGAGHVSSPLAIQVRKPTGEIDKYCQNVSEYGDGPNDQGDNGGQFADNGNVGAGFTVTTFTLP